MPRLTTLVSSLLAAILCGSLFAANTQPTIQSLNKMPLSFTKNMGQWDDRVLFRANSGGATMWFTREGVTYQFTRRISSPLSPLPEGEGWSKGVGQNRFGFDNSGPRAAERDSIEQLVITAKFTGANPNPDVIAEGELEYKCNYFLGNDPTKWHTDVPSYEAITLKEIYPGIDLKYSGRRGTGQAAYEFIAAPGADIAQIKVAYEGAEETSVDVEGRMILKTKWGDMTIGIKSPTSDALSGSCAWWTSSSTTSPTDLAHGDVRQALAGNSGTLSLAYSTYLGGGDSDEGFGLAVDDSGNVYVTGYTRSSNFPTQNPYQSTYQGGYSAVFVTKISCSGNSPIYSTYLGGSWGDQGYGIAVDGNGNAYVTGYTSSPNFPILDPYQTDQDYGDAFVTKLSSSGNSLIYSTYLGGGGYEQGQGIAVDGSGNAFVTGWTSSSDFPTLNPCQTNQDTTDAFVTKLSSSGKNLLYSTYLGGRGWDCGFGITVDGKDNAYVTGFTRSPDFPTLDPFQTYSGDSCSAFVTKLSTEGNTMVYSTYLGGEGYEQGRGIAVDGSGNAYVTGWTGSTNFPTSNPYQTYQGPTGYDDAFVVKLSNSGNSLIYSTYLGGSDNDYAWSIAVDGNGNAYVTGYTESPDFPTLGPFQMYHGGTDAFVTKLSESGNDLVYSTYLGGTMEDDGYGLAIDASGNAYITGLTYSSDFPTKNPYQPYQGTYPRSDVFVTKLCWTPNYPCGDVNTDEQVNLVDAVFLINYIFVGGSAPQQISLADVNCSGSINIADVVLLINYIFRGGPAPCAECK